MFRKASHASVIANFQNTFVLNLFNFSQNTHFNTNKPKNIYAIPYAQM